MALPKFLKLLLTGHQAIEEATAAEIGVDGATLPGTPTDLQGALEGLAATLKVVTRTLTPADLLALATTRFDLVDGIPGKVIVPVESYFYFRPAGAAYNVGSQNFLLGWNMEDEAYFMGASGVVDRAGNTLAAPVGIDSVAGFHAYSMDFDVIGLPMSLWFDGGVDITDSEVGAIDTAVLNSGGADYAEGDTGTVDGGNGDATYVVDSVDGGGAVLTFHLTSAGSGYPAATAETTTAAGAQAGIGTGFTIDIAPPPAAGELDVTVLYRLITVS